MNSTKLYNGRVIDTKKSHEWNCPKAYPDYKITWARFLLYKDWLAECPSCTDGVMLTDVRDAVFQSGEFKVQFKLIPETVSNPFHLNSLVM